jgi:hypothetical protein
MSQEKITIFGKDGSKFTGTMEEVADSICAKLGLPANSIVLTTPADAGGSSGEVLGAIGVMKTTKPSTSSDLPFYGPERPPVATGATAPKNSKRASK